MATLILGTVGRVFGGPIGGLIGSIAGGLVDRSLFGGGSGGGRLGNLEVQSAAYGEPIPIIIGRMRAAGNLIWSSGISETAGGGKSGGSGYSYSASFAVALAAGPITGVGRIWADGTEIRNDAGVFASPVTMRLHSGSETQTVDPLIAAAEGSSAAPAYRGIAYAVFDDLPLAEFGNRIPNLTFEIIVGDDSPLDMGMALQALARSEGRSLAQVCGGFPAITGHVAVRAGNVADNIAPLVALSGAAMAGGAALTLAGDTDTYLELPVLDCHAHGQNAGIARDRQTRQGGDAAVAVVELGYFDSERAFQAGLQRVRRGGPGSLLQQSTSSAMPAVMAKQLASTLLARAEAARTGTSVCLPWRHLGVRPGLQVRFADDDRLWRVRATRFEGFVVQLDLERVDGRVAPARPADAGRALEFAALPAGETIVQWLDLPILPGEAPVAPRLWLAAAGTAPGWRGAPLAISRDDGFSYQAAGTIAGGSVQGVAVTVLPPGTTVGWDRFASVDIELLSEAMWLQPVSEAAVLAGANLALLGDELVQFTGVDMLAPRRFRLSGLLRGRQGSEATVAGHADGERFVLLDTAALLSVDLPVEAIGRSMLARALGSGDGGSGAVAARVGGSRAVAARVGGSGAVAARVGGRALLPLSPAHLGLRQDGDDIVARWVRRSRSGFGWADFIDAPLAEASEAYCVTIWRDSVLVRSVTVTSPGFRYAAAERLADGGTGAVELRVSQISALVGPGATAVATLALA